MAYAEVGAGACQQLEGVHCGGEALPHASGKLRDAADVVKIAEPGPDVRRCGAALWCRPEPARLLPHLHASILIYPVGSSNNTHDIDCMGST